MAFSPGLGGPAAARRGAGKGFPSADGFRKLKAMVEVFAPEGRGEDLAVVVVVQLTETSPRGWGRRSMQYPTRLCPGNTPTGVGTMNTPP